ncbi:MAG: hypothetical protein AAF658_09500 [Myxococcota bacterium]
MPVEATPNVRAFQRDVAAVATGGLTPAERAHLIQAVTALTDAERATVDRWLDANYGAVFDIDPVARALPLPDANTLDRLADRIVNNSFGRIPDVAGQNRYVLSQRLSTQDWTVPASGAGPRWQYDGSDVVVIAFEGTGAHEPRLAPAVEALTASLQSAGYDTNVPGFRPTTLIEQALQRRTGQNPNWSGLQHGLRTEIARNPEFEGRTQWLSFPSEEVEVLASPDAWQDLGVSQLVRNIADSCDGTCEGIEQARDALRSIVAQAHAKGKRPHFVVVSHSSGGRAAVKFLEFAKDTNDPNTGRPLEFPLVFTIDPVREAQEAAAEAAREIVNKGTEHGWNGVKSFFGAAPSRVWPPTVRSRVQPHSLYKVSTTHRWINVLQKSDEAGIGMHPEFGIHGSPIRNADDNVEIFGLSRKGHGEICYDPAVCTRFRAELATLLP